MAPDFYNFDRGLRGHRGMKSVSVKIRGFEKYKGRGDVKLNSWFRCSNRLMEDHEFFDFTHEEMLVWIYFLSVASQKNTADIVVHYRHAEQVCRLSPPSVDSAIKKLKLIKCIEIIQPRTLRGRYAHDTFTCATGQDNTGQDKTIHDTATFVAPPGPADFELIYSTYPLKKGKTKGLKKAKIEIKTSSDLDLLRQAISNYKTDLEKNKTAPEFIKHFSTFMGEWRDWLAPDAGSTTLKSANKYEGLFPEEERP